jgi:protein-S-isoprenylcysteine O-methyltransferase Ste14
VKPRPARISANGAIVAATLFGGASLLLLGLFLLLGPIYSVDMGLSIAGALGLNAALCLLFFVQHSGMVRKSFQQRLAAIIPYHYHGAIYSIASGAVLFALLLLWQPTELTLASADGLFRSLLRGAFFAAILGFLWSARALGAFDTFGIRPLQAAMRGKTITAVPLAIRGPYRWVRHPIYAFVLVMLWSYPDLTADRLLLNATWTIWIFVGTILEERDLVAAFGQPYREYQRQVPMLLPWRMKRKLEE